MPQLEEMHEDDTFLEHLEGLKEHPGWLAYQAWVSRQIAREAADLEKPWNFDLTNRMRGRLEAFRLCSASGLQILIDEHAEKLKEVRK